MFHNFIYVDPKSAELRKSSVEKYLHLNVSIHCTQEINVLAPVAKTLNSIANLASNIPTDPIELLSKPT